MNIRCTFCNTPINVNRDLVHAALDEMNEEGHQHFNLLCPRCRKTNKVSQKQLKRWAPNWKPSEKAEEKE